jgi:hypothetical protein
MRRVRRRRILRMEGLCDCEDLGVRARVFGREVWSHGLRASWCGMG